MDGFQLNAFDWTVIAVVALSSVMGFARGIIREVFTAVGIVIAAVAVLIYLRNSEALNLLVFIDPAWLRVVATAALIFVAVFVGVGFATSSLAALLHKNAEINALDRGAGFAWGFFRAALIAVFTVVLARHVTPQDRTPPDLLIEAELYPVLERGAEALEFLIEDKKHLVRAKIDKAAEAAKQE